MDHHEVVCPYMNNNPFDKWDPDYKGYCLTEILQPIIAEPSPMWFYDPSAGDTCRSAEDLYATYLGAVKHGNLFDLGVSPNREGKLRDVEVRTLQQVGKMIRNPKLRPFSLSTGKPAKASSVWRPEYDASKAVDDDDTSSWAAAPGSTNGWLEVDLGREEKLGAVEIRERFAFPCYPIKRFAIEYKSGNDWKAAAQGTTIGIEKTIVFPMVRARFVRLNILNAEPINNLLVVEEFRVWPPNHPEIRLPLSAKPGATVTVSGEWTGRAEMIKENVNDGDFNTIWGGPENSRAGWVQIDLGAEHNISGVLLDENNFPRVFKFEIRAQVKNSWKTLATGTTIGRKKRVAFKPIRASVFRVVIQEATDVPVLSEFQLLEEQTE
jgi:alpha-L-fucosidase